MLPCRDARPSHQRLIRICFPYLIIYSNACLWGKIAEEAGIWHPWSICIIYDVLKSILDHSRNDAAQKWTRKFKTRICIDLNEPYVKIGVDHEIHTKNFKIISQFSRIYSSRSCPHSVGCHFSHLRIYVFIKSRSLLLMMFIDIVTQFFVTNLIPFLELSILR